MTTNDSDLLEYWLWLAYAIAYRCTNKSIFDALILQREVEAFQIIQVNEAL